MPYLVVYNEDTHRRVVLEGFQARKAEKKATDNPHGHGMALVSVTLASAWYNGWLLAGTNPQMKELRHE